MKGTLENFSTGMTNPEEEIDYDRLYEEFLLHLPSLQDKIKRESTIYKEEFSKILKVFTHKFNQFLENPHQNIKGMKEMFIFFAQVGHIFPAEVASIPLRLITLIENNYSIINHEIRLGIVESLSLLRKKDLIDALEVLPLFFKLLRCQDKILRRRLHEIIISDLQRINSAHKNNSVNKKLQNFCIDMLNDPNKKAGRKTLNIMIILYKKKVWNDAKTINAIGHACLLNDSKIIVAACQFFLSEYQEDENDTSDEEELDELKNKYKLLGKANNRKTKTRKHKLKALMKSIERREKRKSKVKVNTDFMPIDLIHDHTNFADKLFYKLNTFKENFKLKLILMRLIGRIIGRHKIFINNFFNYILNFLTPNQKDLPIIFASLIEATHDRIPPVELTPIVTKLFDNFISEAHPPQYITIGLNCLREMMERAPYILTRNEFEVIETLKDFKNKSVTNSTRSLINLCKELNNGYVHNRDRDEQSNEIFFGQDKVTDTIDGIELLKRHENLPKEYKMEHDVILDDIQLKKLKVLKLKYNAEKLQHRNLGLSKEDVNDMAGDNLDNEEDEGNDADDEEFELEDLEGLEEEELEELEDEELEDDEAKDLPLHESDVEEQLEIDSDELKTNSEEEDEDNNPHGFVNPETHLLTYKKRFREKKDELQNQEKEEYKHNRKEKLGGKTNVEKLKSKPMMMVLPKKRKQSQKKSESTGKKIKNLKRQLGRFKRGNMILKKKGGVTHKKKKK